MAVIFYDSINEESRVAISDDTNLCLCVHRIFNRTGAYTICIPTSVSSSSKWISEICFCVRVSWSMWALPARDEDSLHLIRSICRSLICLFNSFFSCVGYRGRTSSIWDVELTDMGRETKETKDNKKKRQRKERSPQAFLFVLFWWHLNAHKWYFECTNCVQFI